MIPSKLVRGYPFKVTIPPHYPAPSGVGFCECKDTKHHRFKDQHCNEYGDLRDFNGIKMCLSCFSWNSACPK